jgi:hypothetical protein
MSIILCTFCHTQWKYKKDYDKHLACCEYFYQLRRNPQREMDDYGNKLPSQKELFRFVQELSLKCERLEREVSRLKATVSVRQKKIITDCLNHSEEMPSNTFYEWWKNITLHIPVIPSSYDAASIKEHWSQISNPFLFRVFQQGLVEGIKYVLDCYVRAEKSLRLLPIRCFSQKPNVFYIYCEKDSAAVATPQTKSGSTDTGLPKQTMIWKTMANNEFEMMVDYLSQLFVREFLEWQTRNLTEIHQHERRGEEQMSYMMKVNSMRPSKEKGIAELRKWLFTVLEENAQTISVCEYV